MKSIYIVLFLLLFSISGCGPPISKSDLRETLTNTDYYAEMKEGPARRDLGNCFFVSEDVLKEELNQFYQACASGAFLHVPDEIPSYRVAPFRRNLGICAQVRFVKKYKDYFSIYKRPQYKAECRAIALFLREFD